VTDVSIRTSATPTARNVLMLSSEGLVDCIN